MTASGQPLLSAPQLRRSWHGQRTASASGRCGCGTSVAVYRVACPCSAVHAHPHRFPGSMTALLDGWGVSKAALSTRLDENVFSCMCQALGRSDTPNSAADTPSVTEEVSCVARSPAGLTLTAAVTVLS